MPKLVEVDEVELLNQRKVVQTVQTVLSHPKAGPLVEQALKMVDPNVRTPRLDAQTQAEAPLKAIQDQMAELAKTLADDKAERTKADNLAALNAKVEGGKAKLRQQGWTDDGIKAVEALMQEKGLLDPLDAAAIYERDHPPQLPATPSGHGAWNFVEGVGDGEADLKKLIETKGQSDILADKMARDALNDVRGSRR